MNEEWRDIEGYEGKYQISNLGRVKSLGTKNKKEKILKFDYNNKGYKCVRLYLNGKGKHIYVHRLVAEAFIDNPNKYPWVNHRDENPKNNCVDNLEWCTRLYNTNYGSRNQRVSNSKKGRNNPMYGKNYGKNPRARRVQCVTTGKVFSTIKEASEYYLLGNKTDISACCKGKLKSAGKHPVTGEKLVWKYID